MHGNLPPPIMQACTVPYRFAGQSLEFCLITSIGKRHWVFPKGIVESWETPIEAALKEAFEEAGIRGDIVGDPLGQYEHEKWDSPLLVTCYLMQMTEVFDEWPESGLRARRFVSLEEARERLFKPQQREIFDVAVDRLCRESSWRLSAG